MREIRVRGWRDLLDALFADSWREDLGRHRLARAFRGTSVPLDLSTALMRMGGAYEAIEGPMLRAFRKYARVTAADRTVWDWLALAQHHGLPTRLLDWTHSPFVAMHFATALAPADDGEIWTVDYRETNRNLPAKMRAVLRREGADMFSAEMLSEVARSLPELDRIGGKRRPFIAFFEPPSIDERIVNQFALFSLASGPRVAMDEWLARHAPDAACRIVIPASLKPRVRDFLDQANVTERVLFPGLDGLAGYLRRYYRPTTHTRIRTRPESRRVKPLPARRRRAKTSLDERAHRRRRPRRS